MATLKSLVDETTNIKNEIVGYRDRLKQILIDKKIEGLENENKLSIFINKVNELDIVFKKYLYKEGDENVSLTGGWKFSAKAGAVDYSFTKSDGYMQFLGPSNADYRIAAQTSKLIDLSDYNKLCALVSGKHLSSSKSVSPSVFISSASGITGESSSLVVGRASSTQSNETFSNVKIELDISNIKSSLYVYIETYMGGYAGAYSRYSEIWLEK